MPYITEDQRAHYDLDIEVIVRFLRAKSMSGSYIDGDVNYIISRIVAGAFGPKAGEGDWSYFNIARATAAFECAKQEFYRRIAAPKENLAISTNNDIEEYKIYPIKD